MVCAQLCYINYLFFSLLFNVRLHSHMYTKYKQDSENNGDNRSRDCACGWPISWHVLNFNDVLYINGVYHTKKAS